MQRYIGEMTSDELRTALDVSKGVIIPIASTEQMGLHGPIGADVIVANYVAPLLAEKADMLYSDAVPFGDALEMSDFLGTVNIRTRVLGDYYYDIASSFFQMGARRIVFLMTHSLNSRAADYAARRIYSEIRAESCILDWWKAAGQAASGIIDDSQYGYGHGGEMISSVLLGINPNIVHIDRSSNEIPKEELPKFVRHIYGGGSPCTVYGDFHDYCISGTWGDVSLASAEKGKVIIEAAVEKLVGQLSQTELL